jgi:hypothetical protein
VHPLADTKRRVLKVMSEQIMVAVIGLCAVILAAILRYWLSTKRERRKGTDTAKAEILLALDAWWTSIKAYETSMGEMGSVSVEGVLPASPEIAKQLKTFRATRTKLWSQLDRRSRREIRQVEDVFLGFIAQVYSGAYGHEVWGDQVPREILTNDRIRGIIGSGDLSRRHSFSDCEDAFKRAVHSLEG